MRIRTWVIVVICLVSTTLLLRALLQHIADQKQDRLTAYWNVKVVEEELERRGGRVTIVKSSDGYFYTSIVFLEPTCRIGEQELELFTRLPRLYRLHVGFPAWKSDSLSILAQCKHLQVLSLGGGTIDMHLKCIVEISSLTELSILSPNITDEGIGHLGQVASLETLTLEGTQITDKGLTHLKSLKELRFLYLRRTLTTEPGINRLNVTEAGVDDLRSSLPDLTIIRDQ